MKTTLQTIAVLFVLCIGGVEYSFAQKCTPTPTPAPAAPPTPPKMEATIQTQLEIKQNTLVQLRDQTMAQRYVLFQNTRNLPQNAGGVVTLDGKPKDAQAIRDAAKADGTYQPFAAVFDVLGSFGDAGNGSVPAAQSGIQTQLFGTIAWESQHLGYANQGAGGQMCYLDKFDFSLGGSIGLYPELVLQNLSSTTATITQPNNRPMFQDAFRWSIGPRLNHPIFSHGELIAFGDFGQNYLINQVTSFRQGDDTITATPVMNNTGRAAFFMQGGVQAKIYSDPIWLAHDNKTTLNPLLMAAAGVRKDTRFSASGDLAGFDHPQDRLFVQFLITLTNIMSYSNDVRPAPPASMRFGVDIEKPIIEARIPTATRFFVSANVDVLGIFRPNSP